VDLLGDWWTPLVLREACYGVRRFEEVQRNLRIGRNILSQRLRRLCNEEMMKRVKYQDRPPRYEYVLTEKGREFFPVIAAIVRWGDTWLAGKKGAPVILRHRTCGAETHAEVVCSECKQPLRLDDVEAIQRSGRRGSTSRASDGAAAARARGARAGVPALRSKPLTA
jgi:DNA-binding HxlR family transcriptional regulator